jgi:hypothetical protein
MLTDILKVDQNIAREGTMSPGQVTGSDTRVYEGRAQQGHWPGVPASQHPSNDWQGAEAARTHISKKEGVRVCIYGKDLYGKSGKYRD